jgi:hypothetical protein
MPNVQIWPRNDISSRKSLSVRDLSSPLGSTNLTSRHVIGIAVAGAVVIFLVVCTLLVRHARHKDRLEQARILEEVQEAEEQLNFKAAVLSISAPDITVGRRLSADVYEPRGGRIVYSEWEGIDPFQGAKLATKPSILGHGKHTRTSKIRDSWPLASIPLSILPGQSTMTLNQVAPPGYLVEKDSRWPRRSSSSRHSRTRVAIPFSGSFSQPLTAEPVTPTPRPRNAHLRNRSTSETHLSTILRSTSQRLKAAQRHSLTRTLTSFSRLPGSPPKQRLPTPPGENRVNESSEGLVPTTLFESPSSSLIEAFMRTPSPDKQQRKAMEDRNLGGGTSSASSMLSEDSLCEMRPSETVVPGHLTSPNKQSTPSAPRYRLATAPSPLLPSQLADTSTRSLSESCTLRSPAMESEKTRGPQRRISTSGDPFYSSVKTAKPVSETADTGLRPHYIRKATFGQESTSQRPPSYTSPLQDVSGNVQFLQRKSDSQLSTSTTESNPFQWSPQEAMKDKPRQRSPQRTGGKPKGHKRSNVIRLSNLIRPPSTISVTPVLEESEEETTDIKHDVLAPAPLRLSEWSKSLSPVLTAVKRRSSGRPPSVAVFNPTLNIPELKPHGTHHHDQDTTARQSKTLSDCNYYTEHAGNSEEDFFQSKLPAIPPKNEKRLSSLTSGNPDVSPVASNNHEANRSESQTLPSSEPEKLMSFPPPVLSLSAINPRLSSSIVISGTMVQSSPTSLAPPLLTMPIPGHLTGPRRQPGTLSPSPYPHQTLQATIGMLRRMNSEISRYSICSDVENRSPSRSPELGLRRPLPAMIKSSSATKSITNEIVGKTRGSRHYLSLGASSIKIRKSRNSFNSHSSSARNSRVLGTKNHRDSNNIYKERRRRRMEEESLDADLETVREFSTHKYDTPDDINFSYPKLPHMIRSNLQSPTTSPGSKEGEGIRQERWSEVMSRPVKSAVRRESQMKSPSPKTPKLFDWQIKELEQRELGTPKGKSKTQFTEVGKARFKRKPVTYCPDSPGMYDDDGFLKSSPFKPPPDLGI